MRRLSATLLFGFLALMAPATPHAAPKRPKLLVLLSVDQFRGDYIERYSGQWTHGLRRLLDHGAYFSQAAYPYMNTVTCAGHSTMSTGTFPATHGLALNGWFDRETGKTVTCTEDPKVRNIAYGPVAATGGDSPWQLRVPTFSDELRLQASVPPHVVAVSLKARSAVTLGGRRADLVTWHDGARGFVTSTAYAPGRVPFLEKFLAANPIEADAGKIWEKTLPKAAYLFSEDGLGEKAPDTWTTSFPHALPGTPGHATDSFYELWDETPFADAYLARMATAAVKEFRMGQGAGTDFLAISFSTLDLVGHGFGPRSHEVQDVLAQVDITIGRLLDDLDRLVGRDQYVVAVTGDHGVAPIPEQIAGEGMDAGRISARDLTARIDAALAPFVGEGSHVDALIYTDLYFKAGVYAKLQAQPEAMKAVTAAIESSPGVLRALRSDDITDVHLGVDTLARTALYSYAPGRSGDMLIVPKPYYLNTGIGTTHGTGYRYDARVPLILAGTGIEPGEHPSEASPADIAPTFAYLAGITMSRTDGHILQEALAVPAADAMPRPMAADAGIVKSGATLPRR